MRWSSKPVWLQHRDLSSSSVTDFMAFVPGPHWRRFEARPLVEHRTGGGKVHEDLPSARCARQSSPKQCTVVCLGECTVYTSME